MSVTQISYETRGGNILTIDDIEERCIKYCRNLILGKLVNEVTLPTMKRWMELDMNLKKLPSDELLMRWLLKWTPTYLMQWSYENDNKSRDN